MSKYLLLPITLVLTSFIEAHEIIEPIAIANREKMPMEQTNSCPEYLYKVVSTEQWQESLLKNQIIPSSLDKNFIHLSKEDQVSHVVQKFWNKMDHVILKLASKKLTGRLIYETNPGGTSKYYHLYEGNIPLEAVVDVTVVYANK